ncbi:MAG: hypothetical protein ACK58M_14130 [Acidobacteriota bacterium]
MGLFAAALLDTLLRLAAVQPDAAFDRAPELAAGPWRERVQREAFFALASKDPRAAHRRIGAVLDREWLADLPFTLALEQAYALPPAPGQALLEAAARRQPEAALREAATCLRFPYGRAVLGAAIAEAPAEAATLAARLPELAALVEHRNPVTAPFALKQVPFREPVLPALLDAYRADPSPYWRRALAPEAAEFFRLLHQSGLAPLAALDGPQRLTLASLAAGEDELAVLPALLAKPEADALPAPILRRVLALAAELDRFAPFNRKPLLDRALQNLTTLPDALDAAVILGATAYRPPLGNSPFARLLLGPPPPAQLRLGAEIIERFVFPNDDDGVESFASFRAAYAGDPAWQWQEADGVVRLRAKGILLLANIPLDSVKSPEQAPEAAGRQQRVEALLPRPPEILVHRGHDYHLAATLPLIPRSAQVVFLGSCHGTQALAEVVAAAPRAHIVATRGIGTKDVNDPFLRAMNAHLLRHGGRLDWTALWRDLRHSLGDNEHFGDYIPPPANAAAHFLARYYAYFDAR